MKRRASASIGLNRGISDMALHLKEGDRSAACPHVIPPPSGWPLLVPPVCEPDGPPIPYYCQACVNRTSRRGVAPRNRRRRRAFLTRMPTTAGRPKNRRTGFQAALQLFRKGDSLTHGFFARNSGLSRPLLENLDGATHCQSQRE